METGEYERKPPEVSTSTVLKCGRCKGYLKRRYRCPGKRRYKARTRRNRNCSRSYNMGKINLCNRNWSRISIYPFVNFLRVFRRKYKRSSTPIEVITRKAYCAWKKMSKSDKCYYIKQAKRARCRGFRT